MKLIFVYNARSNLLALIAGTAHKLASPKTYQCNLRKLTYPLASMDKEWKKFVESLPYLSVFLHRDEFKEKYPDQKNVKLPAIFTENGSDLRLLISADEIGKAKNIPELIKIVERSLPERKAKQTIYLCPECSLGYADPGLAKQCEAWCREHKSCNLEIIKQAVEK